MVPPNSYGFSMEPIYIQWKNPLFLWLNFGGSPKFRAVPLRRWALCGSGRFRGVATPRHGRHGLRWGDVRARRGGLGKLGSSMEFRSKKNDFIGVWYVFNGVWWGLNRSQWVKLVIFDGFYCENGVQWDILMIWAAMLRFHQPKWCLSGMWYPKTTNNWLKFIVLFDKHRWWRGVILETPNRISL